MCGVLASDTLPVRELVGDRENRLLADFYDVDGMSKQALNVLRDPSAYRSLGQAGAALIREKYGLDSSQSHDNPLPPNL